MSFCGDMRLKRFSLDEQPTQEVYLKEQATLPMKTWQQPSQSVESTHQNSEQQSTKK